MTILSVNQENLKSSCDAQFIPVPRQQTEFLFETMIFHICMVAFTV